MWFIPAWKQKVSFLQWSRYNSHNLEQVPCHIVTDQYNVDSVLFFMCACFVRIFFFFLSYCLFLFIYFACCLFVCFKPCIVLWMWFCFTFLIFFFFEKESSRERKRTIMKLKVDRSRSFLFASLICLWKLEVNWP